LRCTRLRFSLRFHVGAFVDGLTSLLLRFQQGGSVPW
ncbi:hypothetical protein T06_5512, partial [Trichinella sp. T6]